MLKQSASFVLASLRDSTYRKGMPRLLARCGRAGQPFWASCGRVLPLCHTRGLWKFSHASI